MQNLRFYGRRKGKPLTQYRKTLLEDVLPDYQATLPYMTSIRFENWMEVGFGNGEFLSHMCQARSDIQFIGCEPFENGVAALLASIEKPVDNLKLWMDDARLLMRTMPNACLNRFYLLNPDPWPKTRHRKRRFIQQESLDEIARLLKPGGKLIMSSDHHELANWMFRYTEDHRLFEWIGNSKDNWRNPPDDWPITQTRYMKKGLAGQTIYWLIFERR